MVIEGIERFFILLCLTVYFDVSSAPDIISFPYAGQSFSTRTRSKWWGYSVHWNVVCSRFRQTHFWTQESPKWIWDLMWLGYSTLFRFAGFIVLAYGFTGSYTGKQLKTMFASDSNENIGLPTFLHQHPSVVIKYNDSYRENRFYLRPWSLLSTTWLHWQGLSITRHRSLCESSTVLRMLSIVIWDGTSAFHSCPLQ